MEFQAYPTMQKDRKNVRMLLRVQGLLHGTDSVLLPMALLLCAGGLVTYQHFGTNDSGRNSIKTFLAKILLGMLPLVIVEKKVVSCADPIRLFSRFSTKVLLMHASFLGLRLLTLGFPEIPVQSPKLDVFYFVGACILMPIVFGLRPSFAHVWEHRDVLALASMAMCVAVVEVMLANTHVGYRNSGRWSDRFYRAHFIEDLVVTGSDYLELVSFVPAVWMAYRHDTGGIPTEVDIKDSQKRAFGLFTFLLAFYVHEDLVNSFKIRQSFPLAAVAHVAHFLLVLDCAVFLLAHLCSPEKFSKLRGAVLGWVADISAV
eukprot:CAMPEP_0168371840 /NCGR_PEP_ID=MMETSP0228-20121227/7976_1 /TAXON_ID=133427 /ORGANISM="Protoceratium reticulatum, Strain CCCM 535 (=CCMP 1889)" /LENGTH=315 /DNA_ID=CAMNT_0008384735 /DNA_START=63 /DNA_END=1010 /DNA_ORIENTATION=-